MARDIRLGVRLDADGKGFVGTIMVSDKAVRVYPRLRQRPRPPCGKQAAAAVNEALGLTGKTNWCKVAVPDGAGPPVAVKRSMTPRVVRKEAGARERYADRILPTLEDPDEVWMTFYDNGQFRRRFIKLWDDGRDDWAVVIDDDRAGDLWYNFMHVDEARAINRRRIGSLLYAAKRDG